LGAEPNAHAPSLGLHESIVQRLPSSQTLGVPTHFPPEHWSPSVQAFPSLHVTVLFTCLQPVTTSHQSSVQTLPSSQFGAAPPRQYPLEHLSPIVHAFPSLQGAELLAWLQPDVGLHQSSVQVFPSLQSGAGPATQPPFEHRSPMVQAFPSEQLAVLLAWLHPEEGLHQSSVQGRPSSQLGGGPPWQAPPEHRSAVVQAFPSLHGRVFPAWLQPALPRHESSVQRLPSSHNANPPVGSSVVPSQSLSFPSQVSREACFG
jgi:hypothetical protein